MTADDSPDDFIRDLADQSAQHRRDTAARIIHGPKVTGTATHIGRRQVIDRLRADWHAMNTTTTNEKE